MDLTNRDEQARLLKLRLLTLRDENALLKDRLVQRDAMVKQLSKQKEDSHAERCENKKKIEDRDVRLMKQDKELAALQVRRVGMEYPDFTNSDIDGDRFA